MKPFSYWANAIEQRNIGELFKHRNEVEQALVHLAAKEPNPEHAKDLAMACGQHSFFYKAYEASDDRFDSLYLALAQACSRHMPSDEIYKAHLSLTTEVSGPCTHAITMGWLTALKKEKTPMPDNLVRYGIAHHPWNALLSPFAGEFNRDQSFEIASALVDLGSNPPESILNDMIESSICLEACIGCIRRLPAICHYDGAALDIDSAARDARRHGCDDGLHVELFALALESGMPLKLPMLEYISVPELFEMSVAWFERADLRQEIVEPHAPRKNTPSL